MIRNGEPGLIALLTDFGEEDWFVASMKGVIAALSPGTATVDITHRVSPGNIARGGLALKCCYRSFPPGTVFLAVVDPGVGTERAAITARAGGRLFVAPDNGLLSWVLREDPDSAVFRAENQDLFLPEISTTFHGRDVFAPLAARLAGGIPPEETGPPLPNPVILPPPLLRSLSPGRWEAEVVGRDRFGNCLTSLTREAAGGGAEPNRGRILTLTVRGREYRLPLAKSYGSVESGGRLAVWGSCGFLELSVNGGSAAEELGLETGERIELRL